MKLYFFLFLCSPLSLYSAGKSYPPLSSNNAPAICIENENELQLHIAAKNGNLATMATVFNKDNKSLNRKNYFKQVPLCIAAQKNKEEAFLWLLERKPELLVYDLWNNSPLHYTIFFGTETMLLALLEELQAQSKLSDLINQVNNEGFNALGWSILTSSTSKTSILLAYGASAHNSITFQRTYEQKFLYPKIPLQDINEPVTYDMLCLACMSAPQNDDCIIELLLSHNNLSTTGKCLIDKESPLHNRVTWGSPHVVQLLLKNKANPLLVTQSGENALHRAARRGNKDIVDLLLNVKNSVVQTMIDAKNKQDQTPLMLSYQQEDEDNEIYQAILTKKYIN